MLDWLLKNHRHFVSASRWLVTGCAFALIGIARLPHDPVDRVVATIGDICTAVVFAVWLAIVLLTIIRPRTFEELRLRRADRSNHRRAKIQPQRAINKDDV